jgi:DNA-binding transcriptional regulator YdaS (Cro superfamily)
MINRACTLAGGLSALSERLDVPHRSLRGWLAGVEAPPETDLEKMMAIVRATGEKGL